MMNTARPAAHEIRFDDDCFEVIGYATVYTIGRMAPNYPAKFDSREQAEAFARKTGRPITESQEPIRRRIKWN